VSEWVGEWVAAQRTALRLGLCNEVVAPDELLPRCDPSTMPPALPAAAAWLLRIVSAVTLRLPVEPNPSDGSDDDMLRDTSFHRRCCEQSAAPCCLAS
jgi:hypothetical protein